MRVLVVQDRAVSQNSFSVAHADTGWLRNGWEHLRFGRVPALIKGHIQHPGAGENCTQLEGGRFCREGAVAATSGVVPAAGRHSPGGEEKLGVQRSRKGPF